MRLSFRAQSRNPPPGQRFPGRGSCDFAQDDNTGGPRGDFFCCCYPRSHALLRASARSASSENDTASRKLCTAPG